MLVRSLTGADHSTSITTRRLTAAAATAAMLMHGAAAARQFRTSAALVEVYVSVNSSSGAPVTDLTAADFTVRDEGVLQPITAFAAGDFPLSVALALDRSWSMAGRRLSLVRSSARAFLDELRPADQAMLVAIGSEIEPLTPLSTDRRSQYDALARLTPWGSTPLWDAVVASVDLIAQGTGRRALVLLSDGDDRYSRTTPDAAVQHVRVSDVLVYPIAVGPKMPGVFEDLARLSGGRAFRVSEVQQLTPVFRSVAMDLRHQYLIGFVPPAAEAGTWRRVEVSVNRPGARVRARPGYLAR